MKKKNNFIIEDEIQLAKIGTKHHKNRLVRIMSNMIETPGKSTLSQSSSRSEAKATYLFFNNENIDLSDISRAHHNRTIERIVDTEFPVLLIQDTTYVNYDTQAKKKDL
jgi:hypothetical protein